MLDKKLKCKKVRIGEYVDIVPFSRPVHREIYVHAKLFDQSESEAPLAIIITFPRRVHGDLLSDSG